MKSPALRPPATHSRARMAGPLDMAIPHGATFANQDDNWRGRARGHKPTPPSLHKLQSKSRFWRDMSTGLRVSTFVLKHLTRRLCVNIFGLGDHGIGRRSRFPRTMLPASSESCETCAASNPSFQAMGFKVLERLHPLLL